MADLPVLKTEQAEGLHDLGIEFDLGLYVFGDDIDQRGVFRIDAFLHIREVVNDAVDAVPVFAEGLQLVIPEVVDSRPDHAQEQVGLFLLFDQFRQSALVCNAEIQVPVGDQDHLVIAAFNILFLTDLIGCLDPG